MNLLGDGAHYVAIASALVGLVGGTLATSWIIRNRWLRMAKNAVALVLSSALLFLAVGLELNRSNAWYPSTDDIFGSQDSKVPVQTVGEKDGTKTFGKVTINRTDTRKLPPLPSPGQRLQLYTVNTRSGYQWPVQVLLPVGYTDAANAHHAYPVIFFAHGVPGGNAVWHTRMDIEKELDPIVEAHKVQPFIAVIPEVTPKGLDTECILGPSGNNETEDWLTARVPAFVKSHFRVITQREGWAVAGYSAGGWCAALLTIQHPNTFSSGIVLGGFFEPWWGATKPSWSADSPEAKRLDLPAVVHKNRPRIALFVQSATNDTESWPTTKTFLGKVRAPTLVASQVEKTGGHSFDLWIMGLQQGLIWLGEQVPGFKP